MRVFRDENGQALISFAVILSLLALGFLAFAIDAGMLFRERRVAQAAADAAAVAAAEEVSNGNTVANEQTVANGVATLNGMNTSLAKNPATVQLQQSSSWNGVSSTYVTATVTQPIHTYFLGAFDKDLAYVNVSAQAIAGFGAGNPDCVCLEGGSGQDLYMSNGSSINGSSCEVVVNSSSSNAISIIGGSTLGAQTLGTVSSTWDTSTNIYGGGSVTASTKIVQGIPHGCAPAMPAAPSYSSCLSDPGGSGGTITVGPASAGGTICYQSLTVGANAGKTTLNPGIYVISTGYVHFEAGSGGKSNLGGNGVFFYLLPGAGSILIDNGANVNMVSGGAKESGGATAPSTGAYDGILVYQATGNSTGMTVEGGATAYMNGAIYAPSAPLTLGNGSGSTFDGGVIAQTLTMSGGGTLTATPTAGSSVSSFPRLVQ
jgi:Flp pilus assembly protein TadG